MEPEESATPTQETKTLNNTENTKASMAGKWASTRSALETPDVGGIV
jgi:hypothetical protein